jgi:hypothetical protein
MSDTEAKVIISGDGSGAVDAMKTAGDAVQSGAANIKGALNELGESFGKLTGLFATLAAVVGGGKFFKEAMAESSKLTGEVLRLSKSLGITAEEAGTLNSALGMIGSDADTYVGTFQRFAQQMRHNEEGMNAMGVETRDANGHLRDANEAFTEALQVVNSYKPGLDQTTAAQKLFGKSIDDVMKLQKLNNSVMEEARERNEALGLVVTQENVEANKKYKLSMHEVGEVMDAVMKTIGDAVMPIFTELAQYLASTGPYVVAVFKGAMTGLLLVFRTLSAVVKVAAEQIFEALNTIIDEGAIFADMIVEVGNVFGTIFDAMVAEAKLFGTIMYDIFTGDFAGARKAADQMGDVFGKAFQDVAGSVANIGADGSKMAGRWDQAMDRVKQSAKDAAKGASDAFANDLDRLWGPKEAAASTTGKGTKTMGDLKDQKQKAPSRVPEYEAELAAAKVKFEEENNFRERDLQQDVIYWKEKLDNVTLTSEEQTAIRKKMADVQLQVMKRLHDDEVQLDEQKIAQAQKMAGLAIDAKRQEVDAKAAMGLISAQGQIKEEAKLEEERFRITKAGIDARLAILAKDPTKNVIALRKLNDELDAEEMAHMNKVRALEIKDNQETLKDYQQLFSKIGNSFATTMQQLMMHQKSWSQAVKSMYQEGLSAVASYLSQYLEKKLAAFVVEKGINLAGIAGDSAKAGSGAASAMADIPYVGPILAIAAMAAVFAATMGMQSNVKSARGGYDIPSGMNPMVQTHEEEMILPKEQANAVRDMAEGGAGGLTINATPMPGGFWMMHQNELLKVVGNGNKYRRG